MLTYRVLWEIDVEAADPRDAATQALAIQRDPDGSAVCFDVFPVDAEGMVKADDKYFVDLDESPERESKPVSDVKKIIKDAKKAADGGQAVVCPSCCRVVRIAGVGVYPAHTTPAGNFCFKSGKLFFG